MLLHMNSSRAGIVINITSSPCLTYSPHLPAASAEGEWVSIYNPGNAAAVPVSHSIGIIHCCPEHCDRCSAQTILWEHRRHATPLVWMESEKQLKCSHKNNFLPVILVLCAWLLCASPHYCSVLTASLVSAASGSKSHQPPPPPMSGLHGGSIFLPSERFDAICHTLTAQSWSTTDQQVYPCTNLTCEFR